MTFFRAALPRGAMRFFRNSLTFKCRHHKCWCEAPLQRVRHPYLFHFCSQLGPGARPLRNLDAARWHSCFHHPRGLHLLELWRPGWKLEKSHETEAVSCFAVPKLKPEALLRPWAFLRKSTGAWIGSAAEPMQMTTQPATSLLRRHLH